MYKIEWESIYDKTTIYHQQFLSRDEAIRKAKDMIYEGLRSYYKKVITCRITSPLHPNQIIVVRENNVHTYNIPQK